MRPQTIRLSISLAVLCLCAGLSYADCKGNYTQALSMLDGTKKSIAENQHPNPDAFAGQFKTVVDKMQSEKCLPELMSLFQHIQGEQQKYPAPAGKNTATPIVD